MRVVKKLVVSRIQETDVKRYLLQL